MAATLTADVALRPQPRGRIIGRTGKGVAGARYQRYLPDLKCRFRRPSAFRGVTVRDRTQRPALATEISVRDAEGFKPSSGSISMAG